MNLAQRSQSPQRIEPNTMNFQSPIPHSRGFARFAGTPLSDFPSRPPRPLRETIFSVCEFETFPARTLAKSPREGFIYA
jgi:hypothetical protein